MKKIVFTLIAFVFLISADAQQLKTPAPSPGQTIKQDFAIGTIELSYSRPSMKGRKIFGDLVPYGAIWRTGANNATTLNFSEEVIIGGKTIPAGKYGFVTIPGKDEWTLIVTKQLDATGPSEYKMENDLVRVTAKPKKIDETVETFTMQFSNVKPTTCELLVRWENTVVALPIKSDVEKKVMAQIDNLMKNDNRPYFQSAMYYMDNGKDLNQAVIWFDKAIEQNPKAFWVYHQKANALAKLGKKSEAKTNAQKSIDLAKEAKNEDYVKLNEKLLADLN